MLGGREWLIDDYTGCLNHFESNVLWVHMIREGVDGWCMTMPSVLNKSALLFVGKHDEREGMGIIKLNI